MIVVDEREPVGELPPPFPPRNVEVKEDVDMRKYYDLKKEIGRGRFGTVYLVTDKTTGQKFAAKFVNTKRNQDRANVEREVEIMKLLNAERPHPRLIQLYDAFDMDKEMCLVLEVVDGGELFERVIDDDFVLTEKACAIFMRQVCEAVEFIHSKNILHLDMKPENILCLSREGNRIKICDFGLARKYDPRKKLQVLFGTPEFVAPEVVNFEPISFGTDMWSVGVISYVLLSGLSPFMGHNYVETMTNVTHNKYDFSDEAFNCVSDDAKDFIEKLLVLDKSLRLTPAQCQRHPWLKAPPNTTLKRSIQGASEEESEEETETETETESEDEDLTEVVSIEEKLVKEDQENEKCRRKKQEEEELLIQAKKKEREEEEEERRRQEEARKKEQEELERQAAARKQQEERERLKKEELERQAERKRKEEEERRAQARKKEEEERQAQARKKKEEEERKRKEKEEEERKKKEKEEEERIKREKEEQERKKKKEDEARKQVKRKEEEELERTKKNLKEFVERWNSHPNSPYLIGTPLTQLPPELQRIAREEGWSSRASFSSVIVAPPSPPPGELSDDEDDDDDDLDLSSKDEFSHYTFEQRQPSPRRLASQLEVKLSQLKEGSDGGKDKDQDKAGVENGKITKKASETLPSDKYKKEDNDKLSVSKPETKNGKLEKERSKTPEITKKENEKNKKTEETQETVVKSKDGEKPAGGLQKCSSTVFLDDPKKAYQEYQKMVNEAIKKKQEEKKALEERIKARQEELEREASKDYDWRKTKDKKDSAETKKTSNYLKTKETTNGADEKRSRGSKSPVSVYSSTKATNEQLDDHKQAYEDYKRRVSKSEKDAKKNEDAGKAKPREPLRRPEIIALQNEELGGSTARQRKKSLSRLDTGDSLSDRSSRGSTPKSPGLDGATSPKYDFDLEAGRSRSSTPTKQLKKQPSRDVPLQAKNADQEERPGTPVRQKPSRDVPMPYITVEGEERYSRPRRGSRDITPDSPLPPHRKISTEERPPSRESRPGTPLSHRRPSRDVNISSGQLDRLVQASGLDSPELTADQPQMWPDLIVCPQGQDDEECQDYKDSLDVPIATLMKSPSGTLRQVPEVTILQTDKSNTSENKNLDSEGNSSDPTYVPSNKLVAWILDIGNVQNQRQAPFSTSDRVSQWEGKEPSPKPGERSPREKSPRLRTRSPVPSDKHRDKSPAPTRTPFLCPLSREPSSVSLKSSGSSENACIQTPWGELKRSPSRSTLSKSPSFEVPSNKAKDGTDTGNGGFDDHMSVGSSTRSPSPRLYSKFHKQDSMEIPERKDSLTSPRLTGELPPKPPEKAHRSSKEENLNIRSPAKKDDWKSATLPRQAKLAKQGSTDNLKNYSTEKRSSLLAVEAGNTDSLKRKSKFPPSPNQKRKLGSCLLFSAQDRISQFENKQPSGRPPQRPITRTRSSMVFTSTAQENGLENRLSCDMNKNALTSSLNSSYTPSKSCNNTHVEFLRGRLLGKTTKTTGLPPGLIQNVDSVNNNNKRFSIGYDRRDSIGYGHY
ncbi:serine/threonine-protein kinase GIN4-like isoform X1 [Penaeus monodon]|uniref:serine/threonine-protein kinase GIN4-like isoform X1 n=1 Tax=Penaeus monodon TaxID=6687 RepID=UPI0018A709BC|nr:serine/threonine-protein kinase GIN4-like isoform X1 [Penaeus monodon]